MKAFVIVLSMLCAVMAGAGVSFTPSDGRTAMAAAVELVSKCTPRDAGTAQGRRAAELIRSQLERIAVKAKLDPFVATSRGEIRSYANVIAEFPSTPSLPWIVIMSHFDTKPGIVGFQGANDGASTSGLLVALAGALARTPPLPVNVCLVWTDAEECRVAYADDDGFQGSRRAAERFRALKREVKAAVCLDMLGDRKLDIIVPANGTPELRRLVAECAAAAGFAGRLTLRDDIAVGDDHSSFLAAGFPAVDLIDFNYGATPFGNEYWHTAEDKLERISSASLFIAGRITVELINRLAGVN